MTARAVIFCPWESLERTYMAAAHRAGMGLYAAPDLQDFGSQLFRDEDAIGLLWARGGASASAAIHRLREGNIGNRVIVLIHSDGGDHVSVLAKARAEALVAGADDAQPDTIDQPELSARLIILSTRGADIAPKIIRFHGCVYRPDNGSLTWADGSTHLTAVEASIFEHLVSRQGAVVNKHQMMDAIYGGRNEPGVKILDVFICKLRKKLSAATGGADVIETAWGRGYRYNPDASPASKSRPANLASRLVGQS